MSNHTLLHILNTIAVLIELVYDAGVYTRRVILPALVYAYAWAEYHIVPHIEVLIDDIISYDYNALRNRIGQQFIYS